MPPPSMPDFDNFSHEELRQAGEDYLAYSDEQWTAAWDEAEEAARLRAMALLYGFIAQRFAHRSPRMSQRCGRGSERAVTRSEAHWAISAEYRDLAQEAEISSKIAFETAEQRHAGAW